MRDDLTMGVADLAISKIKSLRFATEAAITILRIDGESTCCIICLQYLLFWTGFDQIWSKTKTKSSLTLMFTILVQPYFPFWTDYITLAKAQQQ